MKFVTFVRREHLPGLYALLQSLRDNGQLGEGASVRFTIVCLEPAILLHHRQIRCFGFDFEFTDARNFQKDASMTLIKPSMLCLKPLKENLRQIPDLLDWKDGIADDKAYDENTNGSLPSKIKLLRYTHFPWRKPFGHILAQFIAACVGCPSSEGLWWKSYLKSRLFVLIRMIQDKRFSKEAGLLDAITLPAVGRNPEKPVVFIHGKKDQWLAAKIAEYSLKKNSRQPNRFEVRLLFLEDCPFLCRFDGHRYKRGKTSPCWRKSDPQAFTLLRFLVPQLMGYQGHALVMDSDIFALSDIYELLCRDMGNRAIFCRKYNVKSGARASWGSSVMLLDCAKLKHWKWEQQIRQLFHFERNYDHWVTLSYEDPNIIGELEEEWNHPDTLNAHTRLLHNTRRSTQPWMTGLPYDRIPQYDEKKLMNIVPEHWIKGFQSWLKGEGYLPFGRYEKHPDAAQEKLFFSFLEESLATGFIQPEQVKSEIKKKHIRPDLFET